MLLDRLTERVDRLLPAGQWDSNPIRGLRLLRRDAPGAHACTLYEPVLCLILHGAKEVHIGSEALSFGAGECLLVSHTLSVRSRTVEAPYLALVFELDVAMVRKLYDEVAGAAPDDAHVRAAETHRADDALLDALLRYAALADSPTEAHVLAPLVSKEIHFRLLMAPFGGMLRTLLRHDSHGSAIARAIGHIRADIRSRLEVPSLAQKVGMSVSSFHQHFKAITSTTPLQYQKELRLLASRELLRGGASVTTTAFDVGYESASQFSREYARKFGVPPSQDRAGSSATVEP